MIQKTNGLGFSIKCKNKTVVLINFSRWAFIIEILNFGFCATIPEKIFWRGMRSEGRSFRQEKSKYNHSIYWQFLIAKGEVRIKKSPVRN